MKQFIKYIVAKIGYILTTIGAPLTFLSLVWLKFIIKGGTKKINNYFFLRLGILPVLDHYYQPMVNPKKHLTKSLRDDRELPGIDLNVKESLEILANFNYNEELLKFPLNKRGDIEFYYNNLSYCSGDAEYLYNMVRYFKPNKIIEIGCGNSTLMIKNATTKNNLDDSNYSCHHTCIEPYEKPWLEKVGVDLVRKKVESIEKSFFQQLELNDILFIDSSHIIRPQGDVLFEYLELLPTLKSGVLVHVHDIFMPKDYLDEWVYTNHFLWNEQYLLEAFLTFNSKFKIIGALNYLSHNHEKEFAAKSPIFAKQVGREPGAFWMMKK